MMEPDRITTRRTAVDTNGRLSHEGEMRIETLCHTVHFKMKNNSEMNKVVQMLLDHVEDVTVSGE